jgi:phage-related protein
MEDAMAGASGAGEVAAVRTDAYAQAMENLQGAVQTFNIVAGAPLIENVLAPLVKWLTQVIGNLATAHPGFLKVVGVVLLVSAALGPLLIALGGLTMVIGGAGKAFSAFGGIAKGIGGLLGLLTGPAGPILLIVAALALLVIAWKNNWGDIQGITARVVESLKTFFSNLGASLAETWNSIKTGVVNAWNAIGDALYNAGQSVMRRLSEGIRAAVDWVTGAVGWVVQKIRDLLPGSDAKEGPLSDLFASGKALPMTMAQGILSGAGAVQSAGQRIAAMAKYGAGPAVGRGGPVPIGAGGASYAAPAGGAGQAITITVNNPTGQTSEASIVRQLRNLAYVGALAP